jgi:hypothetical protein
VILSLVICMCCEIWKGRMINDTNLPYKNLNEKLLLVDYPRLNSCMHHDTKIDI